MIYIQVIILLYIVLPGLYLQNKLTLALITVPSVRDGGNFILIEIV